MNPESAYHQPLCLDHIYYLTDIFLTQLIRSRLNHDTDHRLCSAFSHQDTAVVAQRLCYGVHRFGNFRILSCRLLICHTYILQELRIDLDRLRQLRKTHLLL